ncbi:glutathione S-transferase family protein [Dongia sp.]|uniref:glutathione S-transferase family protein n=1 Tax=Dongia sp. TaxID=1977262 RepID=UPI0035B0DBA5
MILVGQYDSPYVRRVAIALRELGFDYTHDTRSVFGDFEDMRKTNPLSRIPSLILDDGTTLIDSAAILDWLDEAVGEGRALLAAAGSERQRQLQVIALASGAIDKAGAAAYERIIRPERYRWPDWMARCRTQAAGALAALAAIDWADLRASYAPTHPPLHAEIITACLIRYVRMTDPALLEGSAHALLEGSAHASLIALSARLEARPAFIATCPPDVAYPKG